MRKYRFGMTGAVLASCIMLSSCTTSSMSGSLGSAASKALQAMTVTDAQMSQYVKSAVQQMDTQAQVAPSTNPYSQRLARMVSGITQVDGIPLNFKVYITSDVNAFACADGSVRVYTGLMDLMTDDEVLGVIGHEIGHVACHHSKNAFKQALLNSALRDGVTSLGGVAGQLSSSQLGDLAESYLTARYSRSQENQADDYGYDFLVANGKNPWSMALAFNKLLQLENAGGKSSDYFSKMFSSHPETESRIKHIVDRCNKDGIAQPTTAAASRSTGTGSSSSSKKSSSTSKGSSTKKSLRR